MCWVFLMPWFSLDLQGVVIPIGAVVTAATGVKKQSRSQGLFLVSVKRSRTIFKLCNNGQDVYILCMRIAHSVVKCVRSNGQGPVCGVVKWSSNKNDGQNFMTLGRSCDYSAYGSDHPLISRRHRVLYLMHMRLINDAVYQEGSMRLINNMHLIARCA